MDENKIDFIKRVYKSPPVYFKNSIEKAVVKSLPDSNFAVRFSGEPEFIAVTKPQLSKLVTDAILEGNEITAKEYESY